MALQIPDDYDERNELTCALCRVSLPLAKATAGFCDSTNHQAYACVSHFMEVDLLIRGWADFLKRERYRYLRRGREPNDLTYTESDINVWLDS